MKATVSCVVASSPALFQSLTLSALFSTALAVPFAGPRARLVAQRTPPVLEKDRNNLKKVAAGEPAAYVQLRDNHAETTFQRE